MFRLEILPWVAASSALFHSAVSVFVLLAAQLVFQHALVWSIIFLPLVVAELLLAAIGLAWFLVLDRLLRARHRTHYTD